MVPSGDVTALVCDGQASPPPNYWLVFSLLKELNFEFCILNFSIRIFLILPTFLINVNCMVLSKKLSFV